MNNIDFIILPELQAFIPPLKAEEFAQLKANIERDGEVRDPLIIWAKSEAEKVLIDGHNRYTIIQQLGLGNTPFKTKELAFEDIEAVKDWMIDKQLGQRNITDEQKSYLRGLQYQREKQKAGGTGFNQHKNSSLDNLSRLQELSQQHSVSEKTIQRDEKYAQALDAIGKADPEMKRKLLNKMIVISKGNIIRIYEENKIQEFLLASKRAINDREIIDFVFPKETTPNVIQQALDEIGKVDARLRLDILQGVLHVSKTTLEKVSKAGKLKEFAEAMRAYGDEEVALEAMNLQTQIKKETTPNITQAQERIASTHRVENLPKGNLQNVGKMRVQADIFAENKSKVVPAMGTDEKAVKEYLDKAPADNKGLFEAHQTTLKEVESLKEKLDAVVDVANMLKEEKEELKKEFEKTKDLRELYKKASELNEELKTENKKLFELIRNYREKLKLVPQPEPAEQEQKSKRNPLSVSDIEKMKLRGLAVFRMKQDKEQWKIESFVNLNWIVENFYESQNQAYKALKEIEKYPTNIILW